MSDHHIIRSILSLLLNSVQNKTHFNPDVTEKTSTKNPNAVTQFEALVSAPWGVNHFLLPPSPWMLPTFLSPFCRSGWSTRSKSWRLSVRWPSWRCRCRSASRRSATCRQLATLWRANCSRPRASWRTPPPRPRRRSLCSEWGRKTERQ